MASGRVCPYSAIGQRYATRGHSGWPTASLNWADEAGRHQSVSTENSAARSIMARSSTVLPTTAAPGAGVTFSARMPASVETPVAPLTRRDSPTSGFASHRKRRSAATWNFGRGQTLDLGRPGRATGTCFRPAALQPDCPSLTSSVQTLKLFRVLGPKVLLMATSAASRPRAINTRPMRGVLLRASKVYQWPSR